MGTIVDAIDAIESSVAALLAETHAPILAYAGIRAALLARKEIALVDVREEDPYVQVHPLWVANLPPSRLEPEAWSRIPRCGTLVVLYGVHNGVDLIPRAAVKLVELGYTRAYLLEGEFDGWRVAGGEVLWGVNVPSKSSGEHVEAHRHTSSLSTQEVKVLLDARRGVAIIDSCRYEEFQTMSISTTTSVPGIELILRTHRLASDPTMQVIVNCVGYMRSIIDMQPLANAGILSPVATLRNGTVGWLLVDRVFNHSASCRHLQGAFVETRVQAQADARAVAERVNVLRIALADVARLEAPGRTVYKLDARTPEEYAAGHLSGSASMPGGQLTQETDRTATVYGTRIVLADDGGVHADMSASRLAQMSWEVYVVNPVDASEHNVIGTWQTPAPPPPTVRTVDAHALAGWLEVGDTAVIDVTCSTDYVARHIPGA